MHVSWDEPERILELEEPGRVPGARAVAFRLLRRDGWLLLLPLLAALLATSVPPALLYVASAVVVGIALADASRVLRTTRQAVFFRADRTRGTLRFEEADTLNLVHGRGEISAADVRSLVARVDRPDAPVSFADARAALGHAAADDPADDPVPRDDWPLEVEIEHGGGKATAHTRLRLTVRHLDTEEEVVDLLCRAGAALGLGWYRAVGRGRRIEVTVARERIAEGRNLPRLRAPADYAHDRVGIPARSGARPAAAAERIHDSPPPLAEARAANGPAGTAAPAGGTMTPTEPGVLAADAPPRADPPGDDADQAPVIDWLEELPVVAPLEASPAAPPAPPAARARANRSRRPPPARRQVSAPAGPGVFPPTLDTVETWVPGRRVVVVTPTTMGATWAGQGLAVLLYGIVFAVANMRDLGKVIDSISGSALPLLLAGGMGALFVIGLLAGRKPARRVELDWAAGLLQITGGQGAGTWPLSRIHSVRLQCGRAVAYVARGGDKHYSFYCDICLCLDSPGRPQPVLRVPLRGSRRTLAATAAARRAAFDLAQALGVPCYE